jgi:pimeloyl-ACP methyl ester carboxylesterase
MAKSTDIPLVLIPGLACTAALFAGQVPILERDRRVIIPDHTAHDSMAAIASTILESAPDRFALAGLSMGGYIALEIMLQAPERVDRICLMDTSARADIPEKSALRNEALELVERGKYMAVCHSTLDLSIAKSRHIDTTLKAAIIEMAVDTGPDAWARQTRAIMKRANSVPLLKSISCPAMVIVGEEDNLTPMGCAVEMATMIPGARLEVIPDCGHMSSMEQPDTVARLLQEWLET